MEYTTDQKLKILSDWLKQLIQDSFTNLVINLINTFISNGYLKGSKSTELIKKL